MDTLALPHRKLMLGLQVILIFIWLIVLTETDSYYSVYLLCAIVGVCCMGKNTYEPPVQGRTAKIWLVLLSGLFSFAVVLANWQLFVPITLLSVGSAGLCFLGGMVVGIHVLSRFLAVTENVGSFCERKHPVPVFLTCFGVISIVDLLYLFFVVYPGVLTAV